jgi:hypothetical protein
MVAEEVVVAVAAAAAATTTKDATFPLHYCVPVCHLALVVLVVLVVLMLVLMLALVLVLLLVLLLLLIGVLRCALKRFGQLARLGISVTKGAARLKRSEISTRTDL